jgi:Flp pilus assembly pilin Flp
MTEYALILGGIALAALAGFNTTSGSILDGALNTVSALISGTNDTTSSSGGGSTKTGGGGGHHHHHHDGDEF